MSRRLSIFGLFSALFLVSSFSLAESSPIGLSAKRDPRVNGREMMQNYEELQVIRDLSAGRGHHRDTSSYEARTAVHKLDLTNLPEITAEELQSLFEKGRDQRPFTDTESRKRRPTWLYPDDGCYARADLVVEEAQKNGAILPFKVFIFGNLSARTANHPDGRVTWWYHVAPIIKSQGVAYVLDPALKASSPLTLTEWVKLTSDPLAEASVCSPHTYAPDSSCQEDNVHSFPGRRDNQFFFEDEWDRIKELGRIPEDELGDRPPWLSQSQFRQF